MTTSRYSNHPADPVKPRGPFILLLLASVALSAAGCSDDPPPMTKDQLLTRANDELASAQYVKAEKDYREVLRLDSEQPDALRQLGSLYFDQGQILQAYQLLSKSAEQKSDQADVQLKLGQIFLSLRNAPKAREAAIAALEAEKGNEQALILLADASFDPKDVDDTQKRIEDLRAHDDDRPGYHLAFGIIDLRQKNETRAEAEFKAVIQSDPKSSTAYGALGTLYLSRDDLKAAGQAFKTAADLSPAQSPMRLRYAEFLIKTKEISQAKSLLAEMSEKTPDFLPPRVALMKIACTEHQDDDCVTRVQNVLAQDPLNYEALFQDGIQSLAKGDVPKAIRTFEYLSNTYKQNPLVRYQLALAYLLQAKSASAADSQNAVSSAESRLNEATQLNPYFEQAVLLSAEIKISKGAASAAIDPLLKLVEQHTQNSQVYYLLASCYLAQKNIDRALAVYAQMMGLFPQDPKPSLLTANVLLSQGQQAEARKALSRSLEISPDFLPAIEKFAELDIADKEFANALKRVKPTIEKDPKNAAALAVRGKIYLAQQDFSHAEADLSKAIELQPELEAGYLLLSEVYLASGRQDQAIKKLNEFADKKKTVTTLMLLGTIYQQQQEFAAARDAYEKLLTVNENFAPALNNLAVIYSEHLGQLDRARDFAKRARERAPNEPHVADTEGWILFKKGDYAAAARILEDSASRLPTQPDIQFHFGMASYMVGDETSARLAFQKALEVSAEFPGHEEARQRLAVLAIDAQKDDATGRKKLDEQLKRHPNDPVALGRLASFQVKDGDTETAIKTYEKVVADYPSFAPAQRRLALLYSKQPSVDVTKAFDLTQKARSAYPDDPQIAKALGILSYRRDYYPRAVELLREASSKEAMKNDPDILYYLGSGYHELKRWSECKATLERAVTLNLPAAMADEAKRFLGECSDALQ